MNAEHPWLIILIAIGAIVLFNVGLILGALRVGKRNPWRLMSESYRKAQQSRKASDEDREELRRLVSSMSPEDESDEPLNEDS